MNINLQDRLFKRFNFYHPEYSIRESLMAFGFECGSGWFDLLWELSLGIEKELNKLPIVRDGVKNNIFYRIIYFIRRLYWQKLRTRNFSIQLIKYNWSLTRYKMLPFYVTQVKEKYGSAHYYTSGSTTEIEDLIALAEKKSEITCEECGKPGKLYVDGWCVTLCKVCKKIYDKKKNKINNKIKIVKKIWNKVNGCDYDLEFKCPYCKIVISDEELDLDLEGGGAIDKIVMCPSCRLQFKIEIKKVGN